MITMGRYRDIIVIRDKLKVNYHDKNIHYRPSPVSMNFCLWKQFITSYIVNLLNIYMRNSCDQRLITKEQIHKTFKFYGFISQCLSDKTFNLNVVDNCLAEIIIARLNSVF